jgi:hypothetical protein
MTRKHFTLIAQMLVENERNMITQKKYGQVCSMWADRLQDENPQFNRYSFLKACEVI